ncbi:hypothetical protein ANAPC1_00399 [Anaplasma phagocytophilum]|uniref:Uncharacterized protein n=1 Tax=Anaplasma phagocytophilum TaxID=948 RepID=A0AA45USX4_ANAPH|nr:hypothetical protein ANAPC1_00399 [Anaplasma phagocytophilum]
MVVPFFVDFVRGPVNLIFFRALDILFRALEFFLEELGFSSTSLEALDLSLTFLEVLDCSSTFLEAVRLTSLSTS